MALPSVLISALNGILAGFSQSYVLVLGVYYKLQTFIYLTANGIIQGVSENRFAPNQSLTRGMLITMLYRYAGSPEVSGRPSVYRCQGRPVFL